MLNGNVSASKLCRVVGGVFVTKWLDYNSCRAAVKLFSIMFNLAK